MIGGLGSFSGGHFPGGHLSGARVTALLDEQLSAEEADRAWAHVHGCHACRDRVEREGWVKRRLACLSFDSAGGAPEALKGSLRGGLPVTPGDAFLFSDAHRGRRTVGLAAIGGGAVGAAVMGVLALGAAPASAPTTDRPVPSTSIASVGGTPTLAPRSR
ncbi:MAG TPA: hypothetical protein VGE38_08805 [Nocardioides sp.]|uniref:hypothetical protein n=1 Tax=Nocardioides sp. TaxID=35761 RepID=UPI002EDA4576